jgi:FKBP-type peptidyl-prolyl cis-trans isomerase
LNPGEGPKPTFGKWVTVKYVGTHFDGTEFDKGTYPYQVGNQGPIRGFDDGVRQLGKGGKAKIFIPSVLAYGPQGSGDKIKPNESLAFEIELLDVSDTQPAPPELPQNPAQRR